MAIPANLVETTQSHLDQLVAEKLMEGAHLEFKRDLPPTWNDGAKHEFLADASAFANAGGGDLIYGIDQDDEARAAAIVPQRVSVDEEVRRLQDFLLNSVEPRLPGSQVQPVAVRVGDTSGFAIVIRVPQSWAGPHRVKTNQHFFVREGLRRRQLDIPEIRSMFLRSDSQVKYVRDFRTERLGKIMSGDAPVKLIAGPMLVAHLIPTQSALGLVQIDPAPYQLNRNIPTYFSGSFYVRLNLDGILAHQSRGTEGSVGYSQLFRNGYLESVTVFPLPDNGRPATFGRRQAAWPVERQSSWPVGRG